MTNEQIVEALAKVMGWEKSKLGVYWEDDGDPVEVVGTFDPLHDHNHSYRVEKKMGDDGWYHDMLQIPTGSNPIVEWRVTKPFCQGYKARHPDKLMAKALAILQAVRKSK